MSNEVLTIIKTQNNNGFIRSLVCEEILSTRTAVLRSLDLKASTLPWLGSSLGCKLAAPLCPPM